MFQKNAITVYSGIVPKERALGYNVSNGLTVSLLSC